MITIHWHLLVLIVIIIIGYIVALGSRQHYIDQRTDNTKFWTIISLVLIIIYGGIFWW